MLSESVSKGLVQVCGDDASETAYFAEMMDKFFLNQEPEDFSTSLYIW